MKAISIFNFLKLETRLFLVVMTKEFCVCGYMAIANETLSIE